MMGLGVAQDLSALGGYARSFVSRASTATYIDPNGVLQTAGVNVPRYQNGALLVEGAATNALVPSSDLTNAAWLNQANATTVLMTDGNNEIFTRVTSAGYSGNLRLVNICTAGYVPPNNGPATYALQIRGAPALLQISAYALGYTDLIYAQASFAGSVDWVLLYCTIPNCGAARTNWEADIYFPTGGTGPTDIRRTQLTAELAPSSYIPTTSAPVTRAADITAQI